MITATRLHQHEFDLLSPDAAKVFSVIVEFFRKKSNYQSTLIVGKMRTDENNNEFIAENFNLKDFYNFTDTPPEVIELIVNNHKNFSSIFNPPIIKYALIFVYVFLMTWGIISNCLVCFVVARQCIRKTFTHTGPSPRNLYIVNLAIADLLLCLICMPSTLVSLLNRKWAIGQIFCKLAPLTQGANIIVSSGTITAIAVDRYFTIVRSPKGSMCRLSVATTLMVIWIISIFSLIPQCIYQETEVISLDDEILFEICLEKWPSRIMQQIYSLSLSIIQFILPVIVLSVIHVKISMYLNVHLSTEKPRNEFSERANRELRRNRRTMWILSVIAVVFAVSWLPLTIFTILVEFQPTIFQSPEILYYTFCVCHIIAMSSAGTNPLLYGYLNTNFRRDLTNVWRAIIGTKTSQRRKETKNKFANGQAGEGVPIIKEVKSTTNIEPVSLVVRSRDRRTSSSFGTTLTTTILRTRSSSFGLTQQKIEEV